MASGLLSKGLRRLIDAHLSSHRDNLSPVIAQRIAGSRVMARSKKGKNTDRIRAEAQIDQANEKTPVRDKVFPKDNRFRKLEQAKAGARGILKDTMDQNRKKKAQHNPGN